MFWHSWIGFFLAQFIIKMYLFEPSWSLMGVLVQMPHAYILLQGPGSLARLCLPWFTSVMWLPWCITMGQLQASDSWSSSLEPCSLGWGTRSTTPIRHCNSAGGRNLVLNLTKMKHFNLDWQILVWNTLIHAVPMNQN